MCNCNICRHCTNTYLDINRNSSLTSLSLSSLLPPTDNAPPTTNTIPGMKVDECVRSHSPVLEGMDSQLAKYAQLKDLEVAYRPSPEGLVETQQCRKPDGQSDPDSDPSPPRHRSVMQGGEGGIGGGEVRGVGVQIKSVSLPRRSPGTGRSSSSSEMEEVCVRRAAPVVRGKSMERVVPVPPLIESKELHTKKEEKEEQERRPLPSPPAPPPQTQEKEKEKSRVIPRFSRLFGGMRKISRSPSQISSKGSEDKIRSKASKRQSKTSQISLGDSSPLKIEKVVPDKPTKTKHKFFSSKDKCSTKSPIHISSKNVRGTLSSGNQSVSLSYLQIIIQILVY